MKWKLENTNQHEQIYKYNIYINTYIKREFEFE